jgi:KDO2-lipid IV(A) lauroyltransferase
MKNAPVQHRFEYTFYVLAKAFLRTLSHRGARGFGRGLGRLGHRLLASQRRLAMANLALTLPELGEEEHRRISRACFEHFGGYFCEFLSEGRFDRDASRALFDVRGWEHVDGLEKAGKGYFIMTGHYGGFELGAHPITLRYGPVQMVARPADNPHIEKDLVAMRRRFGNGLIAKRGAARRMFSAARKGARVGIVIDQRVPKEEGIQVPFLGHPAWNTPVLAFLSMRTGLSVLPVFSEPLPGGRYQVTYGAPIEPMAEGEGAKEAMTRRYLQEIEEQIRRRPELWLWMHRKWQL